ncbi:MAG: DUF1841 family protein [Thioalkalivibrionaceae bacterium]
MYGDRLQMRQQFLDVFARLPENPKHPHATSAAEQPLDALQQAIATVIREHPEYHALLADRDRALAAEFPPEAGQSNPFLHLAMHLSIREQVATDRPAGIRAFHHRLSQRLGHLEGEHRMIECLGLALWEAQRVGTMPDEQAYFDCIKKLV